MIKKWLVILLIGMGIGNIVAWFSGSAPIEFEKIAYSGRDDKQLNFLHARLDENKSDTASMLQLGQLYSQHNEIGKAAGLLGRAYRKEPDNMLIKAAFYSNEGKLAGAMFDPLMGIYKLYRLRHAMGQVDAAALEANSDFSVRLIRLLTFAYVGPIGGFFHRVFEDEAWFNALISETPKAISMEAKQLIYIALANAYLIKEREDSADMATASNYYQKAMVLARCPYILQASCKELTQRFVALDGN
ncbi:hypothetical protein ACL7TT_15680 [Microbulbifer sp. 2304DJ12-6]|uniref:hypothetical protein n=1 Tax=Microbulbifer sp. 2304DJ12-6 TaxID=3233340 RepID=UPI0039AEB161